PFKPLRARYGDGLDAFLREKCAPLAGDVTDPMLGLSDAQIAGLRGKLACLINSAGLVTFNPSPEIALGVNTEGAKNAAELWQAGKLVEAGMDRARHWGWPNTYTYTKALGEQAIAKSGCRYALVRPAIVESALRFPFPGWNEGFTTSAPLAFMGLKGHRAFPAGHKLVLDLIPVDLVAAGILGVAGAACANRLEQRVFQLASGDVNPFYVRRAVELVALYKRRYFRERTDQGEHSAFKTWLDSWLEPYPASARL